LMVWTLTSMPLAMGLYIKKDGDASAQYHCRNSGLLFIIFHRNVFR